MYINWMNIQQQLVRTNHKITDGAKVSIVLAILVATPVFSNPQPKAETTRLKSQKVLVVSNNLNKQFGRTTYICSPAGFGKKSRCYAK